MAAALPLAQINAFDRAAFLDHLGDVFEHAPWVAAAVAAQRPFASADALHRALQQAVSDRSEDERVALFRGHPELAGAAARMGQMTADSVREQGGLALGTLNAQDAAHWDALNTRYRERFGFPFILCVRRHSRASALAVFEARLAQDRAAELEATLREIGRITRLRLAQRIADHGLDALHGRLTTQVRDTHGGTPAAGLRITLHEAAADGRASADAPALAIALTGPDGAPPAPLLSDAPLRIGRYELRFDVGGYYHRQGVASGAWPFLDTVPVVFAIDEPEGVYHLSLTVTPRSYAICAGP